MARVKDTDNAANVGARDWDANDCLDIPLLRSAAALEVMGRSIVDGLFPSGDAALVDPTGKAVANVKGKLLTIVAKGLEVETLLGGELLGRTARGRHLHLCGRAASKAKTAGLLASFAGGTFAGYKRWDPGVNVLEGNIVALEVGDNLGEERGSVKHAALAVYVGELGSRPADVKEIIPEEGEKFVSVSRHRDAIGGNRCSSHALRGHSIGFGLLNEDTPLQVHGVLAEGDSHHELPAGKAGGIFLHGVAAIHLFDAA
mmetsp:Transcript_4570/g.8895  ORF Transcript_4570/g.8895 Transcript_4570/m.8895 type:complete len:258 (+) Transcript_4570:940-1713(+)